MARIPKAGDRLNSEDVEMIIEAVNDRQKLFNREPLAMSLALVLFNIGDRFAAVSCVAGEWEGLKKDIPRGEGVPKCPNGHVMMQGPGLRLIWQVEPGAEVELEPPPASQN